MNSSDKQSFEGAAASSRQSMLQLTPGQRIVRALELSELGMRLKQATAAAKKTPNDAWRVAEGSAQYKAE